MYQRPQLLMRRATLDDLPPLPEPPPGYELRRLRTGEHRALLTVLKGAFKEVGWTLKRMRTSLIQEPSVEATYVIAYQNTLVATASARYLPERFPGSGYLHWVGTLPAHQGRGLGRLLTLRVLYHFRDAGCRDSVLETDDFRLPAIKLYLNLGYIPEPYDPSHPERWAKVMKELGRAQ